MLERYRMELITLKDMYPENVVGWISALIIFRRSKEEHTLVKSVFVYL